MTVFTVRYFFFNLLQKFVDGKIAGKKVVMFSKTYCPFCTKAKGALANHKLTDDEYEIIEIENNPDCQEIQDYLLSITGGRSVSSLWLQFKCLLTESTFR